MMSRLAFLPLAAATLMLAGCAATSSPTRVTRFHLGQPIAPASFTIQPRVPGEDASLQFDTHAAAVARALAGEGFRAAPDAASAEMIVLVEVDRASREVGPARAPGSIGIGLGTGGGGFGIGGSIDIPIGKPRARELVRTELFVQLKRRSEGTLIWEGRAVDESGLKAAGDPSLTIDRLARALFKGFPGESGRTITVK
jgi:hypothetical protein